MTTGITDFRRIPRSTRRGCLRLGALWLLASAPSVWANGVTQINFIPNPGVVGQPVKMVLTGTGTCGLTMKYGDEHPVGVEHTESFGAVNLGAPPIEVPHTYNAVGTYTVTAQTGAGTNCANTFEKDIVVQGPNLGGPALGNLEALCKIVDCGGGSLKGISADFLAGADIEIRIKNVKLTRLGYTVYVKFPTYKFAKAVVYISTVAPQGYHIPNQLVTSQGSSAYTKNHYRVVTGLQPDTPYWYLIHAKDKQGLLSVAKGQFTTKKRVVLITIKKIKVIDDSDDLSAGDMIFSFHANGGKDNGGASLVYPAFHNTQIASGATKSVNKSFKLSGAPDSMPLNSTGWDEDNTGGFSGPSCQAKKPFNGSFSSDSCDRAGATKTFSLTPKGTQEGFSQDFQHYVSGSALKFRVYGRLEVSYP